MFKGFKTERAFYNSKIHALAYTINAEGAEGILRGSITKIIESRPVTESTLFTNLKAPGTNRSDSGSWRVTDLTDGEARGLYYQLLKDCKKVKANIKATEVILGIKGEGITDRQRKKIIRITKYIIKWSAEVTFSKIIEICPELAKRLTPWQIKNTKMLPLFNLMSSAQAHKIIKRLEKVERRNQENEQRTVN